MEEAFLDAYLLLKKNGGSLSHYDFLCILCSELIGAGKLALSEAHSAAGAAAGAAAAQPPPAANHVQLTGCHFSDLVPPTPKKATPQKCCIACTACGVRQESRYHCEDCPGLPGLCPGPGPCYKVFYNKHDYVQLWCLQHLDMNRLLRNRTKIATNKKTLIWYWLLATST